MPPVNSSGSCGSLRLPQLKILRALRFGECLTADKLREAAGLSGHPASLGLLRAGHVERIEVDVDGVTEQAFRATPAGLAALAAADGADAEGVFAASSTAPELRSPAERGNGQPRIGALVPWAGSARLSAEEIGRCLAGCKFVAVPFGGGLSELPHIEASTLLVNDLHRHVINLARVAADPRLGPMLWRRLRRKPFHPDVLAEAQAAAQRWEAKLAALPGSTHPDLDAAEAYFVTQWMGRSGKAGGPGELRGGLALRFNANGGDSALRFSQAAKGLRDWRRVLERCSFHCLDWREFLSKVKDEPRTAVYADPPWPELGEKMYQHRFTEQDHRELAAELGDRRRMRIVVRYLDCALADAVYAERDGWVRVRFQNRNQGNNEVKEVLLIKEGAA